MPKFIPVGVRSPTYTQQALHGDESGDVLVYRLRVHTQLIHSQPFCVHVAQLHVRKASKPLFQHNTALFNRFLAYCTACRWDSATASELC